MGKFFLRLFVLLLITIVSSTIYLSYFGIKTDKFDNLIKNKANQVNQYVKLEFNTIKIHLNPTELNLVVKLQNPKILIKSNEIDLSKLDLFLSLRSFISSDFLLKKAEVAFIKNDIKDLTKITNIFLPRIINKRFSKILKKGNLEGEFAIPFKSDGSIGKDYEFSGKVSDASINLTKKFSILLLLIANDNCKKKYSISKGVSLLVSMLLSAHATKTSFTALVIDSPPACAAIINIFSSFTRKGLYLIFCPVEGIVNS